jgi:hypothetical protein
MTQLDLRFVIDKAGFPMVYVDAVGAYVHWLPVTKVQFETFLCATPDPQFDEAWYDAVLKLNGRVSPGRVNDKTLWNAFLTGVRPDEALRFAEWCGEEFVLPNQQDRGLIYQALKALPAYDVARFDGESRLSERARVLIKRLDAAAQRLLPNVSRTLAEQMFLKYGPLEWVETDNARSPWAGAGEPLRNFASVMNAVDRAQLNTPLNPTTTRIAHYGFRLLRRYV